jgi:sulfur-carrier protein
MTSLIRVELPAGLCLLAGVGREVRVALDGAATQRAVLDALEATYPALRGTIRDQVSQRRRPFIRFFACQQDLSHVSPDEPLPEAVVRGAEAFLVVGAIAGG